MEPEIKKDTTLNKYHFTVIVAKPGPMEPSVFRSYLNRED